MTRGQRRYVSFAGRGGRSRRNNAQMLYLIPPEDRQLFRSRWNEFYKNGRPIFRKSCVVMAKARFDNVDVIVWEFSKCNTGDHAEVKALQQVQEKEQRYHTAESVDLYLSYSPCTKCADVILQFSMLRPSCEFTLMFSCVFRGDDQVHRMGLRRLNPSPGITLRVFTRRDWSVLAEATGSALKLPNPEREAWDLHWQSELDSILSLYEENELRTPSAIVSVFGSQRNRNLPIHSGRASANVVTPSWQRSIGRQTPNFWVNRQSLRRSEVGGHVAYLSQNSEAFNRAIQSSLADETRITVGQGDDSVSRGRIQCTKKTKTLAFVLIAVALLLLVIFLSSGFAS
ncbi:uncharacterized protein [Periplaneta americana]|uniref:uncharacterized protein isoform X2 n=1 Tax=Periplaneta americana TaxID=6978 RepID=UPI0037E9292C